MIKATILNDIQEQGHTFKADTARVAYDAASPRAKKQHQLIYQQGATYGTVGDYCAYLSHDRLQLLEAAGYVRVERRRRKRIKL